MNTNLVSQMFVAPKVVPYPASNFFAITCFLGQSGEPQEISVLLQNLLSEHELDEKSFLLLVDD